SNVTNMGFMFYNAPSFNQDIGGWNVSNVTNMTYMFPYSSSFNQDIGFWDVSSVTNMGYMFDNSGISTDNYDNILIGWSSQVLQSSVAFGADGLTYCSGAAARQSIIDTYGWVITDEGRITPGTDCPYVFTNANIQTAIDIWVSDSSAATTTYGDISTWDVSQVTNMSNLFKDKTTFNDDISSWDVSNVTTMENMFLDTSFNQDIGAWDVSNVTNMKFMLAGVGHPFSQDISSWNTGNVTDMSDMFSGSDFNGDITQWDTSNVTTMLGMFFSSSFNQDISSWNVSSVTSMNQMFSGATSFNQPIGSWDVSNVMDMNQMFINSGVSTSNYDNILIGWSSQALQSNVPFGAGGLKYCSSEAARQNLIDTYGWTITDGGFDCPGIVVLDANGVTIKWTGTSVPSPYFIQASPRGTLEWFAIVDDNTKSNISNYAKNIQSGIDYFTPTGESTPIPFDNIVTTLVTNTSYMFTYSTSTNFSETSHSFNQNISSWDVSNVTTMRMMFHRASSFNQDISAWDVSKVTSMRSMFNN
ncbi:MAG: BspA family leucine-rich repeat surface protein, partial [Flavobacteriales bacterium]